MTQNKIPTDSQLQQGAVIFLDLPQNRFIDGDVAVDWLNLLHDSLFNVFGSNLLLLNWLAGSNQISSHALELIDRKRLMAAVGVFQQLLTENQEIHPSQSLEIFFNNERIVAKTPLNDLNGFDYYMIALSIAKKKLGYLGIFVPLENGKIKKPNFSLLKSPTEITSALKFLWNLITQERDRLNAIINGMIDGVLLINETGDILFANRRARDFLGLDSQSYIKIQNLHQARYLDITTYLEETIENRYESLNKIKKVAGLNRILGINIQKLHDVSHAALGWMIIIRDVTADWEMDRLRKEFIAKITHELHSPLTVVAEGVALVLEGKAGTINEDQKRCLTYARDSVGRMDRLIDNLLRITKLEVSEQDLERRKTVCIKRVLQKLLQSYEQRILAKQIRLQQNLSEATIPINMNRDHITQVFVNLLENSLKYTAENGKIEVGIRQEFDKIVCWVEDSGAGIPKDQQEKIFEKFYRVENETNQAIRGHGLGLAIVREIIERNGGKIWVESAVGKGSRFIFTLPLNASKKE